MAKTTKWNWQAALAVHEKEKQSNLERAAVRASKTTDAEKASTKYNPEIALRNGLFIPGKSGTGSKLYEAALKKNYPEYSPKLSSGSTITIDGVSGAAKSTASIIGRSRNTISVLSGQLKTTEATVRTLEQLNKLNPNVQTAAHLKAAKEKMDIINTAINNETITYNQAVEYANFKHPQTEDARLLRNQNLAAQNYTNAKNKRDLTGVTIQNATKGWNSITPNTKFTVGQGISNEDLNKSKQQYQTAKGETKAYIQKQVEEAKKKYNGKFDEKAATELLKVENPTLAQQAEIRALKEAYDKEGRENKSGWDPNVASALEAKSGTTASRIQQTLTGSLKKYGSDMLNTGRAVMDWTAETAEKYGSEQNSTAKSIRNWLATNADKLSTESNQNIQNAKQNLDTIGQASVDIGSQMTQMYADMLFGAGKGSLAAMGARVFGGTYQEAKNSGATTNQAIAYSGLQALKEVATEKVFGLAVPVYGRGALMGLEETIAEGIERAASKATTKLGQQAVHSFLTMLGSFGTEGLEEVLSALGDPIVSAVTIGDKSDLNQYKNSDYWSDVMYQFLIGGVMGALGSGITQVTGQSTIDTNRLAEMRNTREGLENTRNTNAQIFSRDSNYQSKATGLIDDWRMPITGISDAGKQVFQGNFAANQLAQNQNKTLYQNVSGNYGVDSNLNIPRPVAPYAYNSEVTGGLTTQARLGQSIPLNLRTAVQESAEGNRGTVQPATPVSTQAQQSFPVSTQETLQNAAQEMVTPQSTTSQVTTPVQSTVNPIVDNINRNVDTDNNITDSYTPVQQTVQPTTQATQTTPTQQTTRPTYTPSAISQATNPSLKLSKEAQNRRASYVNNNAAIQSGVGLGSYGKRAYQKAINLEVNEDDYTEGFVNYYNAGLSGVKLKDVKSEVGNKLLPEQKYAAWVAGQNDRAAETRQALSGLKAITVSANPRLIENEHSKGLSKALRDQVNQFAKKTGVEIEFVPQIRGGKANGVNLNNGRIQIALDAEDTIETVQEKVYNVVLRHEVGHELEGLAPEEYEELSNHIMSHYPEISQRLYGEAVDFNTAINSRAAWQNKAGVTTSNADAIHELVADVIGHLNESEVNEIVNKNRNLATKIRDILRDVVARIKKVFGGVDTIEETLRLFDKALGKAEQNVKSATKAGRVGNARNNTTDTTRTNETEVDTTDVQFSIKEDAQGKYVELDVNQHLFDGLTNPERAKLAAQIIRNTYVDTEENSGKKNKGTVIGDDNKAFVNGTTANKYRHPSAHRISAEKWEVRARTAPELENLLNASQYVRHEDPKPGDEKDTPRGIFYYSVRVKFGDKMYNAELAIKGKRKGNLLYEVVIRSTASADGFTQTNAATIRGVSASNNNVSSSDNTVNQYSLKSVPEVNDVRESMTMDRAKNMIDRAFNLFDIKTSYDGEYQNADEWLAGVGAEDVAMNIESDYELYNQFIAHIPGIRNDAYLVEDILNAYTNKELTGAKPKEQKSIDLSVGKRVEDSRFYAPKQIENAKEIYQTATQRITNANRQKVFEARAEILMYSHNRGAAETLGMTQAELNKKLRNWTTQSSKVRSLAMQINKDVADEYRWTGLENSIWLNKRNVTVNDISRLVKEVKGKPTETQLDYIGRTMLAIDSHTDWSWLTFEFGTKDEVISKFNAGKPTIRTGVRGYFSGSEDLIVVAMGNPHTVAHEMGHALDKKWGQELGSAQYISRSDRASLREKIKDSTSENVVAFYDHFCDFLDDISMSAQIDNAYHQDPSETLARFVDAFVIWTERSANGQVATEKVFESSSYYDKFNQSQFIRFAKLLQEKSAIDAAGLTGNNLNNIKYGTETPEAKPTTFIPAKQTLGGVTVDNYKDGAFYLTNAQKAEMNGENVIIELGENRPLTDDDVQYFIGNNFNSLSGITPDGTKYTIEKNGKVLKSSALAEVIRNQMEWDYFEPHSKLYQEEARKISGDQLSDEEAESVVLPNDASNRILREAKGIGLSEFLKEHAEEYGYKYTEQSAEERSQFSLKETARDMQKFNSTYERWLEGQLEQAQKENAKLEKNAKFLKSQMHRNVTNERDSKELNRYVKKLLKDTQSTMDAAEVAEDLNEFFKAIDRGWYYDTDYNGDIVTDENGEPVKITLKTEADINEGFEYIAQKLIDKAEAKDHEVIAEAQLIRSYFSRLGKEGGLRWDNRIAADWGDRQSWDAFRRSLHVQTKKADVNHPVNIDTVYRELAEEFPGWFDEVQISNPADQLRQISEILQELDLASKYNPWDREIGRDVMTEAIAHDISQAYLDIPLQQTFKDKQDIRLKKQHEKDLAKANARVAKERAKAREKMEAERQKNRERLADMRQRSAQSKAKAIEEVKLKYQAKEERAAQRREMREIRNKIYNHAQKISKKLLTPTDSQYVPEELKSTVAEALSVINTESKFTWDPITGTTAYDGSGVPTLRTLAWRKASAAYQKIITAMESGGEVETPMTIDPDLPYLFDRVAQFNVPVHSMTREQLEDTWHLITAIEHSISSTNKAFAMEKYSRISDLAEEFRDANMHRKARKNWTFYIKGKGTGGARRVVPILDLENPYTFFSHFGEPGMQVYRSLRDAQDKTERLTQEVQELYSNIIDKKKQKEISTTRHEFDTEDGYHVTFTTDQLMELYLLSKRPQALKHLLSGGIFQPGIERNVLKGEKAVRRESGKGSITLTENDIQKFNNALSEEEKGMADELQKIVSGRLADMGNEVSVKVFGYKKFGDPNYWAMVTADEQTFSTIEKDRGNARSLKNLGMTKALVPEAKNALEIRGITNSYSKSAEDMIAFSTFLLPMEDCNKLFNFKYTRSIGFKDNLERVAGNGAIDYWKRLMLNIQNGIQQNNDSEVKAFVAKLISNTKGAAVGLNIRVVAQQPTAFFRAAEVMSPDSLTLGLAKGVTPGKAWDKATKWAGIAAIKGRGSFDQGSASTISDDIVGKKTVMDTVNNISGWAAGKADEVTWGRLWNAAEWETKKRYKSLEVGSDKFYEQAARIFSETIDQTQVVDGILQRSQIMRSGDSMIQMATAFMGEPIMTLNMLIRAWDRYTNETDPVKRSKTRKHIARTAAVVAFNAIANAFAQSLVDAIRSYDDDKDYWEKLQAAMFDKESIVAAYNEFYNNGDVELSKLLNLIGVIHLDSNIVDNLDQLTNFPYIKDMFSLFEGYDLNRLDSQGFEDLFNAIVAFGDESKDWKSERQKQIDLVNMVAKLFGVPVKSLYRDFYYAVRTYAHETENLGLMYKLDRWYYNEGSSVKFVKEKFDGYLSAAYASNDMALVDVIVADYINSGISQDDITERIAGARTEAITMSGDTGKQYNAMKAKVEASDIYSGMAQKQKEYLDTNITKYIAEPEIKDEDDYSTSTKLAIEAENKGIDPATYLLYDEYCYDYIRKHGKSGGSPSYKERAAALRSLGLSGSELSDVFSIMTFGKDINDF